MIITYRSVIQLICVLIEIAKGQIESTTTQPSHPLERYDFSNSSARAFAIK